jgi:hypothetical protein
MSQAKNFHRKENYSFFGHSEDLVKKVSTDLTSNEQFKNVAEEQSPFHTAPSTRCLRDYETKNISVRTKEMPSGEVQSVTTITLQRKVWLLSTPSTDFLINSKIGSPNNAESESFHREVLKASVVIKWLTYPIVKSSGPDEQVWFDAMLGNRKSLIQHGFYPHWYMNGWDVLQLGGFLYRLTVERLLEAANIFSQFNEK